MSVPFYPQETPVSCTVACLRMVLAHWNIFEDETTLFNCCRTTMQGTRASDAVMCAQQYRLHAEEHKEYTWEEIQAGLFRDIYPILLLNLFPINVLWVVHAVVVIAVDDQPVTYLDPVYGRKSAAMVAFDQAWMMKQRHAIIITTVSSSVKQYFA